MRLDAVVGTSRTIAATRSRTKKVALLADALAAAGSDVEVVAAYLSGILPQRRLGVGWGSLRQLPEPAAHASLEVASVDVALAAVAAAEGPGSMTRRIEAIRSLFATATADEQRYLTDLITGQTRQGALDGVLVAAIALACGLPQDLIRRAVMLAGHSGAVAAAALCRPDPAAAVAAIRLETGRPARPMLAASAPDVAQAMTVVAPGGGPVAVEAKELAEAMVGGSGAAVFDGEVIALRPDGRPQPFQVTGARTASSRAVDILRTQVPLTPYIFDVLKVGGADLLDEPAQVRSAALAAMVPATNMVPRVVTDDPAVAGAFFEQILEAGHEGVVVKALDRPYAAGRRGAGWVKVKPRQTLDLVVLGVEWGSGRRRGLLSNIHLGAKDPATESFVMLGKTFKGMTDEVLAWQTRRFLELETGRDQHVVWVRPEQVVEIAYDGLQRSSRYDGGLALRFARVIRYRDDKSAQEADTIETVRAAYRRSLGPEHDDAGRA